MAVPSTAARMVPDVLDTTDTPEPTAAASETQQWLDKLRPQMEDALRRAGEAVTEEELEDCCDEIEEINNAQMAELGLGLSVLRERLTGDVLDMESVREQKIVKLIKDHDLSFQDAAAFVDGGLGSAAEAEPRDEARREQIVLAAQVGEARRNGGRLRSRNMEPVSRRSRRPVIVACAPRVRPMARRRGAGAPGGPRRRTAAATSGGSSDDSSSSDLPSAPIGVRAGELADSLIAAALDALRQDHRAELTAHVSTTLPRHGLTTALILARDELAERGIDWRWAPVSPQDGDERLRLFIHAERTSR
jgi:hypothetical protein